MAGPRSTRLAVAAALLLILILGAGLRFQGITDLGPRVWDEGNYILEGRYFHTVAATFLESARLKIDELKAGDDRWQREAEIERFRDKVKGKFPMFGRLTHDLFIAATIALAGDRPWSASAVNATLGTLSILALFVLGRRLYGNGVGLISALIIAVSGFHVLYSRSGLAEADSVLFAIAAVFLYACSREGEGRRGAQIFGSGLLLGIGYTVHNRLILMIALFWLYEAHLWFQRGDLGRRDKVTRFLLFHAGLLVVPALWEFTYYLAMLISRHFGVIVYHPTFLEQTVKALGIASRHGLGYQYFRIEGLFTYPYLAWHMDGPLLCVLLLVGIYLLFRDSSTSDMIAGGWFFFHYIYFSATAANTRYLLILLPPAAMIAGKGVVAAARIASSPDRPGRARVFLILFALVIGAAGIPRALHYRSIRDCNLEAVSFITDRGGSKHISTHQPLSEVYVGVGNVERNPASEEELRTLYEEGYRYLLVDAFIRHVALLYWQPLSVHLIESVEERLDPAFRCPNPYAASIPFAFEGNIDFFDTLYALAPERRERLGWIEVYDLAEFFGPGGESQP